MRTLTTRRSSAVSVLYAEGNGDTQCNDPLNDGIYQTKGFLARNAPPYDGKIDVPEVIKTIHGGVCQLWKPVEFFCYWAWGWRITSKETRDFYWKKHTRDDAALTNKKGSLTCQSYVLGTNVGKEPMRMEGVDMPRGNLYRLVHEIKETDTNADFWCLDYHWLKTLPAQTTADLDAIKSLAIKTPRWLLHDAWIIHPDGTATKWDAEFKFPMMCSELDQPTAIIDGWHCRQNSIRKVRVHQV